MYIYPRTSLGFAGGFTVGEGGHRDGEGMEIDGGVVFLGGVGGDPSVSHGLLMVSNGEWGAVE